MKDSTSTSTSNSGRTVDIIEAWCHSRTDFDVDAYDPFFSELIFDSEPPVESNEYLDDLYQKLLNNPKEERPQTGALQRDSSPIDFQNSYDEQQTHFRRRYLTSKGFKEKVDQLHDMQTSIRDLIDLNKLSETEIVCAARAWGTLFLQAIGLVIVDNHEGVIDFDRDVLKQFSDTGDDYAESSLKAFESSQVLPIVTSCLTFAAELSKLFTDNPICTTMALGAQIVAIPIQAYIIASNPLLNAGGQSRGARSQEVRPRLGLNVSTTEFPKLIETGDGKQLVETSPYPRSTEVAECLDLLQRIHSIKKSTRQGDIFHGELKAKSRALEPIIFPLEQKKNAGKKLSGQERADLTDLNRKKTVINSLLWKYGSLKDRSKWAARGEGKSPNFSRIEADLRYEQAIAKIAETFNTQKNSGAIKSHRYLFFGAASLVSLANSVEHLCVPAWPAVEAITNSTLGNITSTTTGFLQSATTSAIGLATTTGAAVADVVQKSTGFDPVSLALKTANLVFAVANPLYYRLRLGNGCAEDLMDKYIAFGAALALLPQGKLAGADGYIDPSNLDRMITCQMKRILSAMAKGIEKDLAANLSASMTSWCDLVIQHTGNINCYQNILPELKSRKTTECKLDYIRGKIDASDFERLRSKIEGGLLYVTQAEEALSYIKAGNLASLLRPGLLKDGENDQIDRTNVAELLRSSLVIAGGGVAYKKDRENFDKLITLLGDIERRGWETDQESQKVGISLSYFVVGSGGTTMAKMFFEAISAAFKLKIARPRDAWDIAAASVNIIKTGVGLASATAGYMTARMASDYIDLKNRFRQLRDPDAFVPPNASILDPENKYYYAWPNSDRRESRVKNFATLFVPAVPEAFITRSTELRYELDSPFWPELWEQMFAVDLDPMHPISSLKKALSRPVTELDIAANEVAEILASAKEDFHAQLTAHMESKGRDHSVTTKVDIVELLAGDIESLV